MTRPLAIISGAGVAGLAAAWWLDRAGWRTLIIERAEHLRGNGYMLGLSGLGYETACRMGIHDRLAAEAYEINENVYLDSRGQEILRLRYRDFLKGLPYLAVRRTTLVKALQDVLPASATLRFSRQIAGFVDHGASVTVTLDNGEELACDLLIGADGARSALRRQLFGADGTCLQPLGYYFAVYDLEAPKEFDTDFVSYAEPGHLAEYYSLNDGRLAAMHVWRDAAPGLEQQTDKAGLLATVCAQSHPKVRHLTDQLRLSGARPVIDSLTMIDLPRWSSGRVMLLGDAAHCLTLVSGQGAGMALASAEMLAEALAGSASGSASVGEALARHEARLRPVITRLQARSRKMAAVFIPQSRFAFHLRNIVMRNMPRSWLGHYFTRALRSEIELARGSG
ncbi:MULTISPECIES: FAD-dependent monooxygenase [unclassified Pannonibacter]|uniref:FAD-dependent monooxygenase n=1 Tax=unclassified Pannonibacter TaxID=2627228 RepID=UPI001647B6D8|nr:MULTISPECIES: FAD-dependent monooxygenase [unclassified Pannonibacter]